MLFAVALLLPSRQRSTTMSLGEVSQVSEDVYAYLQPDGSWYLNNTASWPPHRRDQHRRHLHRAAHPRVPGRHQGGHR